MQLLKQATGRHRYLAALSLESWQPYRHLPGAGEHRVWPRRPASNQGVAEKVARPVGVDSDVSGSSGTANVSQNRSQVLADALAVERHSAEAKAGGELGSVKEVSSTEVLKAQSSDVVSASDETVPVFELRSAMLGDLLIVDDVTGLIMAPSAYLNWLRSIGFSLGRFEQPEIDAFSWPLLSSDRFDSGAEAASQTLQAWFQRKCDQKPRYALFMGAAPRRFLASGQSLGHVQELEFANQQPSALKAVLSYGTTELWQQPILKRDYWQHLNALCR